MSTDVKDYLLNPNFVSSDLYLKKKFSVCNSNRRININDFFFFRVDEITFEDDEKTPRKEVLENFISSMNAEGMNFVYLVLGDSNGVSFYYGVSKDLYSEKEFIGAYDVATEILRPSLQGNFRGSKVSLQNEEQKKSLYDALNGFKRAFIVEGVPSVNKDDDKFQSVDRLVDVMVGEEFALLLVMKSLPLKDIDSLRNSIHSFYNEIVPYSKQSEQTSTGITIGATETKGTNYSETTGHSDTKGKQKGKTEKVDDDRSNSETGHEDHSDHKDKTEGTSYQKSESTQKNNGSATTMDFVKKMLQQLTKYIDETVLQRVDYGIGKGLFLTSTAIMGNDNATILKLKNTMKAVYGSENGNLIPLTAFEMTEQERYSLCNFQIPEIAFDEELSAYEQALRKICFQYFKDRKNACLGNWMTSKELSLVAGIPQKEVIGLSLKEEVEFGLNVKNCETPISLGNLVQSGNICNGENSMPDIEVSLSQNDMDKHIFITGTTGSGKTTTCQRLLLSGVDSFLVIEPAKTEYRILKEQFPDMLVFTLGKEDAAPFRLNPLEFSKNESITSRVDMIIASMNASFDMEAAIPQLLESALYRCYEEKGWDIGTNKNYNCENPFAETENYFPTLEDLKRVIIPLVKEQGFDAKLKDEYIGSIKARLEGLMVGAKGLMLNTPRSINFYDLLDKKVVLELENLKSSAVKSLVMGFVLMNLNEALKDRYNDSKGKFKHITLIEEAHRLLSKYEPGDSPNKKYGIEIFSDMLSEVRKYGESLIIVDQIPNKMTSDVLKNTNTKIVHKIFAQDDKDAVGNIMALTKEQKEHLSYLVPGRAVMVHPGLEKPVQVQISRGNENDTGRVPPKDGELRQSVLKFYASKYKTGIIPGLENLEKEPDINFIEKWISSHVTFKKEFHKLWDGTKTPLLVRMLKDYKNSFGSMDVVASLITKNLDHRKMFSKCFDDIISNENFTVDKNLSDIIQSMK